jgi:hypothetical protein
MLYSNICTSAKRELTTAISKPATSLFLAWAIYTSYIFLHSDSLVTDEQIFLAVARLTSYWSFITEPTSQLYGSLYWILLKLSGGAFIARLFTLAMFLATPYLAIKTIKSHTHKSIAFCLWLTMPAAWWGGKLVAPEIPAMFLVAVALYLYDRKRLVGAAIALGLAVGIKITALPALVFFALTFAFSSNLSTEQKIRSILPISAAFIAAVFIAYPPIIQALKTMSSLSANPVGVPLADAINKTLFLDRWEWDIAYSGGILNFSLKFIPLCLFFVYLLISSWRQALLFSATAAAFLAMNSMNDNGYGWYWFPIIPIVISLAGKVAEDGKTKHIECVILICIASNAYLQAPLISDFIYQKSEQIRILANRDKIFECLKARASEIAPAYVFNNADVNLIFTDTEKTKFYNIPHDADVIFSSSRNLTAVRGEYFMPERKFTIHAMCDSILVLSRNK